jgi:hypothetical protein
MLPRNVGIQLPIHTVSHPRRTESSAPLLQKTSKLPGFVKFTVMLKSHQHLFVVDTSTAA